MKTKQQLPPRQREAYEFIADFIEENKYPPSVREIMDGMGIESPNGVIRHLDALEAKGFIGRKANISRAIWIT
jgi:repressor LexA